MRGPIHLLHLAVFLSGMAATGLQVTWIRWLSLRFGMEANAVLGVVLAVFLGLASGAWLLGDRLARSRRPSRWAVLLEAVAAAWAWIGPGVSGVASRTDAGGADPEWFPGAGGFLASLILCMPASMAMGAGLAAAQRVARGVGGAPNRIGGLYAAQAMGSAVGAVGVLLLLLPFVGHRVAFLSLGAVLACTAVAYSRWWCVETEPEKTPGTRPGLIPGALLFGSGALGIGFQMVVVRWSTEMGASSVFSYAWVLSLWLLGTSAGAAWWRRKGRDASFGVSRWRVPPAPLAVVTVSIFLAGAWMTLLARTPYPVAGDLSGRVWDRLGWALIPVLVGPATWGMGGLFSGLVERFMRRGGTVGTAVAWNTVGCALAPVWVGVWAYPDWGVGGAVSVLLAGYALMSMGSGWRSGAIAGVGVVVVLGLKLAGRDDDFRAGMRLIEVRRGRSDTAAVVAGPDQNPSLVVNRRYTMGGVASTNAASRQAQIPLLLHPAPREVLFLGMGTGITAASAGWHDGLRVEVVELSPEVVGLRPHFRQAMPDPEHWSVHVGDARRWVRTAGVRYDVVVGDLFHPGRDGAAGLFTVEHFRALRSVLRPGGVACQWIPLYQFDRGSLGAVFRAWESVFPGSHAWWLRWNTDVPVVGMVGFLEAPSLDEDWYRRRVTSDRLLGGLRSVGLGDGIHVLGGWVGALARLGVTREGTWMPVDDRPTLAVRVPWRMAMDDRGPVETLMELAAAETGGGPFDPGPSGDPWRRRVGAYRRAGQAYLRGLLADADGDPAGAEAAFLESVRLSPDFPSGYSQLLARALGRHRDSPDGARRLLEQLIEARPESRVAETLLRRLGEGAGR